MLPKLNNVQDQNGFTLIELMLVIGIIGILPAIAIPQFSAYKAKSCNSSAISDLRNAATAQEAYYVNESTYCKTEATLFGDPYNLYLSDKVAFTISTLLLLPAAMLWRHIILRETRAISFVVRVVQ